MRISEIKDEELRVLAKLRARQHADRGGVEVKDLLCEAFIWEQTVERAVFWNDVDDGKIIEIKTDTVKETIEILNDTIKVKDQTIGNYMDLIEVLEGRINSLSEFNNALIGML